MKKYSLPIMLLIGFVLLITACEKDDPEIPNEEELITTITYTLTPTSGGSSIILKFVDLDGDGGGAPVITGGILTANQTYTGSLDLLNEAASPIESITEEIKAEGNEHQFFFESTISDLSVTYNDQDTNGNPVGLNSTLITGDATTGSLTIILRHEPDKLASGVSSGDIANAGGETDTEVTFPLDVQ